MVMINISHHKLIKLLKNYSDAMLSKVCSNIVIFYLLGLKLLLIEQEMNAFEYEAEEETEDTEPQNATTNIVYTTSRVEKDPIFQPNAGMCLYIYY